MATKKKSKGPRIALHLPAAAQALYVRCMAILAAILADTVHFVTPYPPVAELQADLAALAAALTKAAGGDPVATAALVVAADKVRQDFVLLGKYAESVVRAGPVEDAPAIISNVLMYESNAGQRPPKQELQAKPSGMSGVVLLIALAVESAMTYYWQFSLDQVSWSDGPQTAKARVTIAGLTSAKMYYFRFRAFKRDGTTTAYSQVVMLLVP
jgi:hypothetical protein